MLRFLGKSVVPVGQNGPKTMSDYENEILKMRADMELLEGKLIEAERVIAVSTRFVFYIIEFL